MPETKYAPSPEIPRWWRASNTLVVALGQILLFVCLFAFALVWGYLPGIDPSQEGFGPFAAAAQGTGYVVHVGLIAVAMIACTGLPPRRSGPGNQPRAADRPEPEGRSGAGGQGWAGASTVVTILLGYGFISLAFFSEPGDDCVREWCSPLPQQVLALAAPMVLAGILMILAAFMVNRWSWWTRALAPPLIWLVLLFVQAAGWDSWLIAIDGAG
jgi:hypothetical protein